MNLSFYSNQVVIKAAKKKREDNENEREKEREQAG